MISPRARSLLWEDIISIKRDLSSFGISYPRARSLKRDIVLASRKISRERERVSCDLLERYLYHQHSWEIFMSTLSFFSREMSLRYIESVIDIILGEITPLGRSYPSSGICHLLRYHTLERDLSREILSWPRTKNLKREFLTSLLIDISLAISFEWYQYLLKWDLSWEISPSLWTC